jgi:hypothetical protein
MTPHAINICDKDGNISRVIPACGNQIRLTVKTVDLGFEIVGIKVTSTVFGEPVGLPNYSEGTWYIVSQLVKSALPERKDLLVPAEVVRDASGNILGCMSLGI